LKFGFALHPLDFYKQVFFRHSWSANFLQTAGRTN